MAPRPEWLVVALGAALLFPLQATIDARKGPPVDLVRALPADSVLPVLALGHRETAADLLELEATNYLMRNMDETGGLDPRHLERLYGAVLTLDPDHVGAAVKAAVYLSAVAARPRDALALLERLERPEEAPTTTRRRTTHPQHPQRWRLAFERGSIHLVQLAAASSSEAERSREVAAAGAAWLEAAALPGAPPTLADPAERLAKRGLSRLDTLRWEVESWRQQLDEDDPLTREEAARRLRQAESALRAEELTAAIARAGRPVRDVEELARIGLDVTDPAGVGFLLRNGVVIAPAYEAARLERLLRERAARRRERTGELPTPEQVGLKIPDYLEAIVTDEGAWVFPHGAVGPFPPLGRGTR